jgi:hypothetical protein
VAGGQRLRVPPHRLADQIAQDQSAYSGAAQKPLAPASSGTAVSPYCSQPRRNGNVSGGALRRSDRR